MIINPLSPVISFVASLRQFTAGRVLSAGFLALGMAVSASAQTVSVSTFAGQPGTRGAADGAGTAARFFGPSGIVADGSGGFYVADALNNTIRRITSAGVVTTIAGGNINEISEVPERGYNDGTGRDALFSTGIAVTAGTGGPLISANYGALTMARDSAGNIYLADTLNHVIRKITPTAVVTTLAGSGGMGSANGTGSAAQFSVPYGVAVDPSGNVYVSDSGNNMIRKITPAGVVTTFAGLDGSNAGSKDGAGVDARFSNPTGIVADSTGVLYVSDSNNHTIRKISTSGNVSTFAGTSGSTGSSDGLGSLARFNKPSGLTIDSAGNLYVIDTGNGTVRKITSNGIVSTIAGLAGNTGSADGTGNAVRLATPYGIALDGSNNIYIADSGNHVIRKGTAVTGNTVTIQSQPKAQYVNINRPASFTVSATATTAPTYQWRKNNVNIAGATNATLSFASAQNSDQGTFSVVVTSGTTSVTSTIALLQTFPETVVIPPILILTQPGEQSVTEGQSATFVVEVAGSVTPTYQWQKERADIPGATNSVYTIPSTQVSDSGSYRVVIKAGGETQNSIDVPLNVSSSTPPPPPPPPQTAGRIINLSILSTINSAGDEFTMGYVVGGNGTSGAKPLVIRAVGPTLATLFGVGGTLDDPRFSLFASTTKTGENNDWGGSAALADAMAAVGAFAYNSPSSKDAALTANITSRDNSVVISSNNNGSGTVLAEIYDSTSRENFPVTTPRLINVSVRKHLGSFLTVGFVLGGSAPTKVLIRAVGPTLGGFGVPGVVADPQLTLFNAQSTSIGGNNDWGGTAELTAAMTAVGAFSLPADSKDAAVVATLQPGNYTVQVSGVNNTTGVAIVEVYEVP